jgi:hypothetical protein
MKKPQGKKRRQQDHPEKVGVTFDRSSAGLRDKTVPERQIPGVGV